MNLKFLGLIKIETLRALIDRLDDWLQISNLYKKKNSCMKINYLV